MSKHTPGPWRVSGFVDGNARVTNDRDVAVAHVRGENVCPGASAANAALIASAPLFLDVLKTTAGNLRSLHGSTEGAVYESYSVWLQVVEAAIAQADGRS